MVSLAAMQETQRRVQSLGREDPLERERVTHSSVLAWRLPWTEGPGGLQPTGSQRVGHDRHTPDSDSGSEEQDDDFHCNKLVKVIESCLLVLFIELFFPPELRICLSKEGVGGPHSSSLFLKYLFIWLCQVLVEASQVAQLVKNPPAVQVTPVQFLGWEDPLEKGKATHSSILAWRIPWTV